MSNNGSGKSTWVTWLGIFVIAGIAAFLVLRQFFPEIVEQIAAGIVAFFAFLFTLVFRRKNKGS
ncbi:MAG: hypothetical protein R3A50_08045 [Saprospiraceae bacterium]|nr:hypothetical protein [Saprospiraceae bacterium]MCB9345370.1 hypothetical protein [Lewinellaceae bacterium]